MKVFIEYIGSGPDLILLHGWGLHSGLWGPFIDELAKNFTVTMVDLPGHGNSAQPEDGITTDSMVQLVSAALEKVIDRPAMVLGWSLGAFVALGLADRFPDRFDRLVWIAGTPSFVKRPDWSVGMAPETLAGFADGLKQDYRATLKRFISLNGGKGGDRALLKTMQDRAFERGEPTVDILDQGLAILRDSDQREQLAAIAQPMLLLQGSSDRLVHPDTVAAIQSLRPAESLLIEAAGHAPFLSNPRMVARAIQEFIQ